VIFRDIQKCDKRKLVFKIIYGYTKTMIRNQFITYSLNPIKVRFYCSFMITLFILTMNISPRSFAADTVRILKPPVEQEKRTLHKQEVILRALQVTEPEFGPFSINSFTVDMTPDRALQYIEEGKIINTFIVPKIQEWEAFATPIKIPIRLGLLSYRLLLIHQEKLSLFKEVKTFEQLSQLTAGLQADWLTTEVFNKLNMKVMEASNFEGLFLMLDKSRFDYLPRAIYEVYDELQIRQNNLENVVVEPNIALYLPMFSYIYVSKNEPRLSKRLQLGLEKLLESGEMKSMLDKYYKEDIDRANLKQRTIIQIPNPNFTDEDMKNIQPFLYKY
jgi:ABC-type amino acid transport substrate-binding protein